MGSMRSVAVLPALARLCVILSSGSCRATDGSRNDGHENSPVTIGSAASPTIAVAAHTELAAESTASEPAVARRRAWPVPPPGRGLTFSAGGARHDVAPFVSGPAALRATADR